jgi:nucleoid DNA-binding protein
MSKKITFKNLIEFVANKSGNSKQKTRDLLKEVVAVVNMGLLKDERVSISGLGIFSLKWRDARQGRNPQTGETIEIPAHNQVKFKPEAALRRFINRKYEHLKPEDILDRKELHLIEGGKAAEEKVTAEKVVDEEAVMEKAAADEVKVEKVAIEKASETRVSYFQKKRSALVWKALIFLLILFGLFILFQSFNKTNHLVAEKTIPIKNITTLANGEISSSQLYAYSNEESASSNEEVTYSVPETTAPANESVVMVDEETTKVKVPVTVVDEVVSQHDETTPITETKTPADESTISIDEKEVPQLKVTVAAVNEVSQQYDNTVNTDIDMSINKSEETVSEGLPGDTEQGYYVSKKVSSVAPIKMPYDKYKIKKGDSLWSLAKYYYKSSYLWPNILRENILVINNPDFIKIGSNIQIPHLEGKVGSLTSVDLYNIVDGYILAYLAYIRMGKSEAYYYLWVAGQHKINGVFEKYNDKIDDSDWNSCKKIKGSVQIK